MKTTALEPIAPQARLPPDGEAGGGLTEADEIRRQRATCVLGAAPAVILETLPRFGSPRFLAGNGAVRVDQVATSLAVVPGGALILLCDDAELWPFPRNWRLGLAVEEPLSSRSLVSLRFFDGAGSRALEIHVDSLGNVAQRVRTCIARWRTRWSLPPRFDSYPRAHAGRDRVANPGLASALNAARESGCESAVRLLESRHGLARLEAISMIGTPWARRIPAFDLEGLFASLASRRLPTRFIVGNPGASYVRRGALPHPLRHRGTVTLRGAGFSVDVRESRIAQLWAVRLRAHGRDVTSLEAFDAAGAPAFLMVGARDRAGHEARTWRAFVDGTHEDTMNGGGEQWK